MRKLLIPSALLATAFVCSPFAFAGTTPAASTSVATATSMHSGHRHHHHWRHRMHHRGHHMRVLRKLDLTESQRTSIHQLMQQNFQQAHAERQALRGKRMAFAKAMPGSAAYQSAANDLAKAEAGATQTRVLRRADLRAHIYQVLTPAQRTRLADLKTQRRARREKWRATHMHHAHQPAKTTSSAQ